MALTKMNLNWGVDTAVKIKIDGGTEEDYTGSNKEIELAEGNHTVELTIVETNKRLTVPLVVPKSIPDRIAEMDLFTQDQVDALNAQIATLNTDKTTLQNQVDTLIQEKADLQTQIDSIPTQIEDAIAQSQGYIDLVSIDDVSVYNTGETGTETLTKWDITYKIIQPSGGAVPAKTKIYWSDGSPETIEDVVIDTNKTVTVVYSQLAGSPTAVKATKIEVLAGNNKVIDKLDLTMLVTETDVPCKSYLIVEYSAEKANFNTMPIEESDTDGINLTLEPTEFSFERTVSTDSTSDASICFKLDEILDSFNVEKSGTFAINMVVEHIQSETSNDYDKYITTLCTANSITDVVILADFDGISVENIRLNTSYYTTNTTEGVVSGLVGSQFFDYEDTKFLKISAYIRGLSAGAKSNIKKIEIYKIK